MNNSTKNILLIFLISAALIILAGVSFRIVEGMTLKGLKVAKEMDAKIERLELNLVEISNQQRRLVERMNFNYSLPTKPENETTNFQGNLGATDQTSNSSPNAIARINKLEQIVSEQVENQQLSIAKERAIATKKQKLAQAANDPVLTEKYYRYLEDINTKHHTAIEQEFYRQGIDPGWSQQTDLKIRGMVAPGTIDNLNLISSECRNSMCRTEFSIPTGSHKELAENELIRAMTSQLGNVYMNIRRHESGDGQVKLVTYISRNKDDFVSSKPENFLADMDVDQAVLYLNNNY